MNHTVYSKKELQLKINYCTLVNPNLYSFNVDLPKQLGTGFVHDPSV